MPTLTRFVHADSATSRPESGAGRRCAAYSIFLALFLMPHAVAAQSAAEWSQIKSKCNLPASTVYNDWVAQGCPCNQSGSSSTASGGTTANAPAPGVPAGMTPEQQLGTQLGMMGANMIGQGLKQLLSGPTPAKVDPAQQQRLLAAQQLNNSGVYLFKQKNYPGAINLFQQALANSPADRVIAANLALAKRRLEQSQRNAAAATETSTSLGKLLDSAKDEETDMPAVENGAALNSVNLDSDSRVVDLRGTTKTSVDPALLKNAAEISSETQAKQAQDLNDQFDKAMSESERQSRADWAELDAEFDKLYNQTPQTGVPVQTGTADEAARRAAMEQKANLQSKLATLNARCSAVQEGSPDDAACKRDRAELLAAIARIQ